MKNRRDIKPAAQHIIVKSTNKVSSKKVLINNYRKMRMETCLSQQSHESSLVETIVEDDCIAAKNLPTENGGANGWGRLLELASMRTTDDMVGLSRGFSWTHRSPIWIHLKASSLSEGQVLTKSLSTTSSPLPSFQSRHACSNSHKGDMIIWLYLFICVYYITAFWPYISPSWKASK